MLAVVLPLVGVLIGATVARNSADQKWLREKRLEAYTAVIEKLMEVNQFFGVELKAQMFDDGEELFGSDIEKQWLNKLVELDTLEMRIRMLGGRLAQTYQSELYGQISQMNEARKNLRLSRQEWDDIGNRAQYLTYHLEDLARGDLSVSKIERAGRLVLPKRQKKGMSFEEWNSL